MAEGGQTMFPVISDKGDMVGIVSSRDLSAVTTSDPMLRQTLMVEDLQLQEHTVVVESDTLQTVMQSLDAEDADDIIVVSFYDRSRPIGVVSHNDIVDAYQSEMKIAR